MSRILIVDDSAANRLVLAGHLHAAGFDVVEATSGPAALAILARERFDLAVLDVLMPGMDGYETCRRMRSDPATAGMPVLFLTALGDRDPAAMQGAGGNAIMSKPFVRADLLRHVRELIAASS